MTRTSKDNVYTIFDRIADAIRDYEVSPETQEKLEAIGKATVDALGQLLKAVLAGTVKNAPQEATKILLDHNKKVVKEVSAEIKL